MNLLESIRKISKELDDLTYSYNARKRDLEDTLNALRKLNTTCENCGGSGKVLRKRSCAEDYAPNPDDPSDWNICYECIDGIVTSDESSI